MKYLPTLDLWDPGIGKAVETGRLKLQRGQWVRCGQKKPSRIVNISERGTIWAVHPQPNQAAHFAQCVASLHSRMGR